MNIVAAMPYLTESLLFFFSTMAELTLLFIGISFLVGVLQEFLPPEKVKRLLADKNGRGYLIGSLLGALTPFCSCSTIPVTVGLLRAKAGFGPTMAFLFTSPLVNPIIVPLFFTLLGPKVTLVYVAVAIGMTIAISYLLERMGFSHYIIEDALLPHSAKVTADMPQDTSAACCQPATMQVSAMPMQAVQNCCSPAGVSGPGILALPIYLKKTNRWKRIFVDAVQQFKKLLPFVVLGVAIGSLIHGFLPADLVARVAGANNPLAVPVAAIVGIPLYLRASTMVPIAASLIAKGMSMGAVVALIIGGAGASLPEVAMLKGIFRLPLLIAFLLSVMAMAVSAGLVVNALV